MGKEDIEKAKKALSKISKEHKKLHELAMQKQEPNDKKESKEKSIEEKLSTPLPAGTIAEVRSKVHAPEPIALKTSEVGLEQSIASVQTSTIGEENTGEDSPYKKTKKAYETKGPNTQSNKPAYEPTGIEQTMTNIRVARPEQEFGRVTPIDTMMKSVKKFMGPEPMSAPMQQEVSAYVEAKRMAHEQFNKEKTTEVKKWYEVSG